MTTKKTKVTPKPPPMGPVMDYDYGVHVGSMTRIMEHQIRSENADKIYPFCVTRVDTLWKRKTPLSRMELEDLEDLVKELFVYFEDEDVQPIMDKVKLMVDNRPLVEDRPEGIVVSFYYAKRRRDIRLAIVGNYHILVKRMEDMQYSFKHEDPSKDPYTEAYVNTKHMKAFTDRVIAKGVFSYNDIYKRTFKNENIFKDFDVLYKSYRKFFGRSPLSNKELSDKVAYI